MTDGNTGAVLTVDRGNSTLDCMVWGGTPRRARLDPDDEEGLRRFLGADCPARAVGLTVVEGGLQQVRTVLEACGVRLLVAGSDLQVPLRVDYEAPEALGIDRLVGALAAHLLHGRGVVVDLGTAVTVNLVRDGAFLGGAIAPGLTALAKGLEVSAPALPRVDLSAEVRLPAVASADAVNAGVLVGFQGLVNGLVKAVASAAGLAAAPHLLTGGQARRYLDSCEFGGDLGFEHVPDLVHQGLRWLATEG